MLAPHELYPYTPDSYTELLCSSLQFPCVHIRNIIRDDAQDNRLNLFSLVAVKNGEKLLYSIHAVCEAL